MNTVGREGNGISETMEKKVKVVAVYAVKTYRQSVGIAPVILNICARWSCVVGFMPRRLHPGTPCSRRLAGPQILGGRLRENTIYPFIHQ
jgi:hypothetical protein